MIRARSRSRERIMTMAVQSKLYRLPQDERKQLQSLRQNVGEATSLARGGIHSNISSCNTDVAGNGTTSTDTRGSEPRTFQENF